MLARVPRPGQRLLRFDRRLGARWVAGTDEAGRGSLAGPLVVAGVLLDYACLRDHRVRPLGLLNDSKQCLAEEREELFHGVLSCAERVEVRVIPHGTIDRDGLHRSNLAAMRSIFGECSGNVRSTPTPNDCLRTVNVSRAPAPWRLSTMPSNTWIRARWPSITLKWTRTVSPALNCGMSARIWARSIDSMILLIGEAARKTAAEC